MNELPTTSWEALQEETRGPYEVSLKENGCIIFVGTVDGHLLVTSKHALGPHEDPKQTTHAGKGEEWLRKHLTERGRTVEELEAFLSRNDVTAVFEVSLSYLYLTRLTRFQLGDDDFEEHILEYPPDRRGLFLHGLNRNTEHFETWSSDKISQFATDFGLKSVVTLSFPTIEGLSFSLMRLSDPGRRQVIHR